MSEPSEPMQPLVASALLVLTFGLIASVPLTDWVLPVQVAVSAVLAFFGMLVVSASVRR